MLSLPLRLEVKTWREKKGWTGPHVVKGIEAPDVVVEMENGPVRFRCTQVMPYYRTKDEDKPVQELLDPDEPAPVQRDPPQVRRRGRPRKHPALTSGPHKATPQAASDLSYEPEPQVVKRGRGRPRKNPIQATTFLT